MKHQHVVTLIVTVGACAALLAAYHLLVVRDAVEDLRAAIEHSRSDASIDDRLARDRALVDERLESIRDRLTRDRQQLADRIDALKEAVDEAVEVSELRVRADLVDEMTAPIRGYTDRFSLTEGAEVTLHFAGSLLHRGSRIARLEVADALTGATVYEQPGLEIAVPVKLVESPRDAGADFPGRLVVPAPEPGTYAATLVTGSGERSDPIYFNVHPAVGAPGRPRTAVLYHSVTWYAYLHSGGDALHDPGRQPKVASWLRPLDTPKLEFFNNTPRDALVLPRFLREHGYEFFCIDDLVLHFSPDVLEGVELLILNVHPEYWTWEMRRHLEQYVERGGRLLVVAGNCLWWKVRIEGTNIICHRVRGTCPETDPLRTTGRWDWPHIDDPAERTLGLGFRFAGRMVKESYPTFDTVPAAFGMSEAEYEASGGLRILDAGHPIFRDTGLSSGEVWGTHLPINWNEADGVPVNADGTVAFLEELPATLAPSTPAPPRIPAGITPLATGCSLFWRNHLNRSAIVAEYSYAGRGRVLHLGTQGWYRAIALGDETAAKIVLNAVDYMLAVPAPDGGAADRTAGTQ